MVITGLGSRFPLIQVYDGGLVELLGDRLLLPHELGQMMDGALLSKLCHPLCLDLGWDGVWARNFATGEEAGRLVCSKVGGSSGASCIHWHLGQTINRFIVGGRRAVRDAVEVIINDTVKGLSLLIIQWSVSSWQWYNEISLTDDDAAKSLSLTMIQRNLFHWPWNS